MPPGCLLVALGSLPGPAGSKGWAGGPGTDQALTRFEFILCLGHMLEWVTLGKALPFCVCWLPAYKIGADFHLAV